MEKRLGEGTKQFSTNRELYHRLCFEYWDRFGKISKDSFRLDSKNWPCDSVYECWRRLYDAAPYCTKNLYIYGAAMLDSMSLHAKVSEAERLLYFQDLMQIYEDRVRRLDSLNSTYIEAEARHRSTKLGVMLKKADVYWHTAPRVKGSGYTREKAYRNFVDAFKQNSGIADEEVVGVYLEDYFAACRDLYESDKEKYMEQFLTDYTACVDACDKMMSAYADGKDSVQWKNYAGARNNIVERHFKDSGAATVENIEKFYSSRLDSMKNDYPALKNAVHLMMTSNDTLLSSNVFYKACRYSYKQHPDVENCIGMALIEQRQMEDRDKALEYFKEAETHATTSFEKYFAALQVGMSLKTEPEPKKVLSMTGEWEGLGTPEKNDLTRAWQARQNVAARKLDEAIGYGIEAGMNGQNLAPNYLSMAQAYRRSEDASTIDLASQALDQIPQLYPAFPQNRIDDERRNIQKVKSNLAKAAARAEEYRKSKAKYEAWQKQEAEKNAKKKAEEDFWLPKRSK